MYKRQTDFSAKWKVPALLTIVVLLLLTEELCVYNSAKMKPLQNENEFAFNLFTTILNAAETSKGIVHVRLRPFSDKTQGGNIHQNAFWRVTSDTTAKVTFELENNRWKKLSVEFDHPLTITLEVDTPPSATLQVGKITYKEDGRVKDLFEPGTQSATTEFVRNGQRAATTLGFYSEALTQLRIVPELVSLLTDQNLKAGPLRFDSVEKRDNSQDNLRIDLRAGTKLQFGINNSNGCDFDSLNFSERLSLSFSALSFSASPKTLMASITRFNATVSDACMASGNTVLRMVPSGSIEISQLKFGQRTPTSSFFSLQISQVDSLLTAGSSLVLSHSGGRESAISLSNSARLKASGIGFEVREGGARVLSLVSAEVSAGNVTGVLAPDPNDHLSFKTPTANVSINSAEWTTNKPPKMQGALSPMQVELTSGDLVFSDTNKLSIQSGTAKTGPLTIDTSRKVPVFGTISLTSLVLGEASFIGTRNRFALEAQGASLITNPANDLAFSSDNPGVNGQVSLSIPNTKGRIEFGDNLGVVVTSGRIEALLSKQPAADFTGQVKGDLTISSGRVPLGQRASAGIGNGRLGFEKLTFSDSDGLNGPLTELHLSLDSSETTLSRDFHFTPSGDAVIDRTPSGPPPEFATSGLKGSVRINAPFSQGEVKMTAGGIFKLGKGTINGTVLAADTAPAGGTVELIAEVVGGTVALDSSAMLTLTTGSKITSGPLVLDQDGSLSGPVPSAHLQLNPNALFIAARGRTLKLEQGSVFDEKDTVPLVFSRGETSPTGEGQLVAKFSELAYPNTPTVSLRKGELRALVSRSGSSSLQWRDLVVTGEQIGSYTSVAEMPDDEYTVLSSSSSGAIETISAPNRVMIVNTVPIAKGTSATFSSNGQLSRAILAEDVTVFGIPLAGGTPVEVNPSVSQVLLGTIGRNTTIEGIPYSKGCLAHLPPTPFDHQVPPCELITSLAFRIKTSDEIMSSAYVPIIDQADDIWIDIGPQAWRIAPELKPDSTLGNMRMTGSLGKGKTAVVEILNPAIGETGSCSALGGPDVPLFVGDIRGIRLEKKGMSFPVVCGLAEGPDLVFDSVPNPLAPPNPAKVLHDLNMAIQFKREELRAQQFAAEQLGKEIDNLQKEIDGFNKTIREFTDKRHEIERLNNDIRNKANEIVGKICPNADIFCPIIDIGRKCHKEVAAICDLISAVNEQIGRLQQRVTSLAGDIAARGAEETFALQNLPIKLGLQAAKVTSKLAVDAQIKILNALVDAAQPIADDLHGLIDHLLPNIIPLPGQWKPESITIIVNGRDLASFTIDQRLKQGHSFEERRIRPMSDAQYFVQGLRVNVNKGDGSFDKPSAVTTPLAKMRGFTGWDIIEGLGKVTITGVLQHNPSEGADAGVSFDLKISEIGIPGQPNLLDGVRHDRFIRIEYRFGTDFRFRDWNEKDTLRVTGEVKRDRDKNTFYEIHLSNPADINRVRIGP